MFTYSPPRDVPSTPLSLCVSPLPVFSLPPRCYICRSLSLTLLPGVGGGMVNEDVVETSPPNAAPSLSFFPFPFFPLSLIYPARSPSPFFSPLLPRSRLPLDSPTSRTIRKRNGEEVLTTMHSYLVLRCVVFIKERKRRSEIGGVVTMVIHYN